MEKLYYKKNIKKILKKYKQNQFSLFYLKLELFTILITNNFGYLLSKLLVKSIINKSNNL